MKFLLAAVNAKFIHSNPAVYSLRAWCAQEEPGLEAHVELAEYTINQRTEEILADIYRKRPDAAAFSCYIWNREQVEEISRELAKLMPHLPVWLGGPEVSYDPQETLAGWPWLTGIMVGEGEETFRELLKLYLREDGGASSGLTPSLKDIVPEGIAGIVYRKREGKEGGVIVAAPPRPLTDIDRLPFFYRDSEMEAFRDRILYYESGRGCPYRCSYCLSSIDRTVRLRDPSLVKRELQFFLDRRVAQVKFVDRTFNCNHVHAMEIWRYIGEHDNGVTNFHFEIAADILTEEELELLAGLRPGLVQLEIGVQSTNPETLREIRRTMDRKRLWQTVARLRAGRNIHIHLDLIAGLPFEDLESFRVSFNQVYACRPEQLQLGFLKVLKGSHMHAMAEKYGIVYTDMPPYEVLFTRWLSYEDVLILKGIEEVLEIYYNSAQFSHTLPLLERCFESPFDMYRALAAYVRQEGYFLKNPSREARYQLLFYFALAQDPEGEQIYRQLLTLDLYLRENRKNRPAFALPACVDEEERRRIVEFYRKEEKEPKLLSEYVQAGYDSRQMARMTHVERFTHPVWEEEQDRDGWERTAREKGPFWLLFDYQKRNPLNKEAETVLLDPFA